MRLSEIIVEHISLTRLHPGLKDVIIKAIQGSIPAETYNYTRQTVETCLAEAISAFFKKKTRMNVIVRFDSIRTAGEAVSFSRPVKHYITLSNGYSQFIAQTVQNDETGDILDKINDIVDEIVSVCIHELTHSMQHSRQFSNGRQDFEYRSYLGRDKNELHREVRHPTHMFNRIYLSSPQEIAAKSQELALKFIKFMDIDKYQNVEFLKITLPYMFNNFMIREFNKQGFFDTFNLRKPEEHNIFKRYCKLTYQEVMRYIDSKK